MFRNLSEKLKLEFKEGGYSSLYKQGVYVGFKIEYG